MNTLKKGLVNLSRPAVLPSRTHLTHKLEDIIHDINWLHIIFKICAFSYISFIAWLVWQILPLPGHWDRGQRLDRIPVVPQDLINYFVPFAGFAQCAIRADKLYLSPLQLEQNSYTKTAFCQNRQQLLQAMSNGGRVGFDAPYIPQGCRYRWYSIAEICMIMERFDGIVFLGDSHLQSIYNGLNILLRQDLANGALQTWDLSPSMKIDCQCENQFTKPDCANHFVMASGQVTKNTKTSGGNIGNSYTCDRTTHAFLSIGGGSVTQSTIDQFNQIVPKAPKSQYKPIPIIHSLSPMVASHKEASVSLLHILKLADLSERKTSMLWIGPNAAGHIEIKGRKSNQEIWGFAEVMAKIAFDNDIEVLNMWNMTVQASSWDGFRFGENVALVQAMMVINWLSRLESS